MFEGPTALYLTLGSLHALKNNANHSNTDTIVRVILLACIVEILCQMQFQMISWMLVMPATVVSLIAAVIYLLSVTGG